MMRHHRSVEVAIVGAGPVGIELAVALKKEGIDYVHFDAGQIGSTIEWYAPQTHFFSSPERIAIAGVPLHTLDQTKATREEYLMYLRAVVQQFDLSIETFSKVTRLECRSPHEFVVTAVRAEVPRSIVARNVVLSIGDMHRPRLLGVPGEDFAHVSHYFRDPHHYFRRKVLIVGGKNSAVEAAIRCFRVGAEVGLSYHRSEFDPSHVKFWLLPELRSLIRDERMAFFPDTSVIEISSNEVLLRNRSSREEFRVEADAVLLMTGYEQESSLLEQAGVILEGEGRRPQYDPRTMETNVSGLYVAGTASAGTQLGGVKEFIETSHVHVDRILGALLGRETVQAEKIYEMPES